MDSPLNNSDVIQFSKGAFITIMTGSGFFTFLAISFILVLSVIYFCIFRSRISRRIEEINNTSSVIATDIEMALQRPSSSPRRITQGEDDYFSLDNGVRVSMPPRTEIQPSPPSSVEDLTSKCCICVIRRPKIVIDDCGHYSLCDSSRCLSSCGSTCPICRKPIKKFIRVFNT